MSVNYINLLTKNRLLWMVGDHLRPDEIRVLQSCSKRISSQLFNPNRSQPLALHYSYPFPLPREIMHIVCAYLPFTQCREMDEKFQEVLALLEGSLEYRKRDQVVASFERVRRYAWSSLAFEECESRIITLYRCARAAGQWDLLTLLLENMPRAGWGTLEEIIKTLSWHQFYLSWDIAYLTGEWTQMDTTLVKEERWLMRYQGHLPASELLELLPNLDALIAFTAQAGRYDVLEWLLHYCVHISHQDCQSVFGKIRVHAPQCTSRALSMLMIHRTSWINRTLLEEVTSPWTADDWNVCLSSLANNIRVLPYPSEAIAYFLQNQDIFTLYSMKTIGTLLYQASSQLDGVLPQSTTCLGIIDRILFARGASAQHFNALHKNTIAGPLFWLAEQGNRSGDHRLFIRWTELLSPAALQRGIDALEGYDPKEAELVRNALLALPEELLGAEKLAVVRSSMPFPRNMSS